MIAQKTDNSALCAAIREGWATTPRRTLARRLGLSRYQLMRRARALGLLEPRKPWSESEDTLLHEQAGRWSWERLGQEIGRTTGACVARAKLLGISAVRDELTAADCARLVGRDPETVARWIERRALKGRRDGSGLWRVWPSALRELVIAEPSRVSWRGMLAGDESDRVLLVQLIAGEWGVPERRSSGHKDA